MNDDRPFKPGRLLAACGFTELSSETLVDGKWRNQTQAARDVVLAKVETSFGVDFDLSGEFPVLNVAMPIASAGYFLADRVLMLSEEMDAAAQREPDRWDVIRTALEEAGVEVIVLNERIELNFPPGDGDVPGIMSIEDLRREIFVQVGVPERRQPSYLDHDPTKDHSRRRKQKRHRKPRRY